MSWNYAELSKMARANGGPGALVETLIQSGVSQGKTAMYPAVVAALFAGAAAWAGGKWIWKKTCSLMGQNPSEEEVQRAKDELIQGINDYDKAHEGEDAGDDEEV